MKKKTPRLTPEEYYSRDKKLEKHRDEAVNTGLNRLSEKELVSWARELAAFMGCKAHITSRKDAMKFINDNYKR